MTMEYIVNIVLLGKGSSLSITLNISRLLRPVVNLTPDHDEMLNKEQSFKVLNFGISSNKPLIGVDGKIVRRPPLTNLRLSNKIKPGLNTEYVVLLNGTSNSQNTNSINVIAFNFKMPNSTTNTNVTGCVLRHALCCRKNKREACS